MRSIKILVVDDSAFMRKLVREILTTEEGFDVVATARDGVDALQKIEKHTPDVVTLDVEMPHMDGLECLKQVMAIRPTPVVMVSSTTQSSRNTTILAMELGAVDFVAKPSGPISLDLHKIRDELVEKVRQAAAVNVQTLRQIAHPSVLAPEKLFQRAVQPPDGKKPLVVMGTSTGGPRALESVLTKLPSTFPAPILIVQHMPPIFTKSLADRLHVRSEISVKEAEEGDLLRPGCAYIAPGDYHIGCETVGKSTAIRLLHTPPRKGHRPAVDVLFEEVSQLERFAKIAVVMTGMGSDGRAGVELLKQTDPSTKVIAESIESAVVYGMPKQIIDAGLADSITPLEYIADRLLHYV
ncbi:protein-glutamate methylesterase/protein-glutamine glutaminase [Bacillus fonticola]|uniref:protein-glutamate methylesterase/protein-glutamine glutaminase n=1 Tax=Bacillus fonticola TaxID=2728853 RepID=UPI00147425BD|nr:chemotaxis response regulator protein-glutamate methylesterase [Bacillus fonticola]